MAEAKQPAVFVAGDVCLDVVGIPCPGASAGAGNTDNWRLTGEIRTEYLLGGAFQLARFVRAARPGLEVLEPKPFRPEKLPCDDQPNEPMSMGDFLDIAERLTRNEIVHSLLLLGAFKRTPESKKADTIRVAEPQGFSGPTGGDPSMKILPPGRPDCAAKLVVLDDTGNQFRRTPGWWPEVIERCPEEEPPIVLYKLHRPLPVKSGQNPLWAKVMEQHSERCLVIVSADDLRHGDAPISRGLSWERTALDLVWQLLSADRFAPLRDCKHMVVRFGLDGALYWHHRHEDDNNPAYCAWLVYDPVGIEGTGGSACSGEMVGYGSVFTAALAASLAKAGWPACFAPQIDDKGEIQGPCQAIEKGIKDGLVASRRLLSIGFGETGQWEEPENRPQLEYPEEKVFSAAEGGAPFFACQPVPIIPGAAVPDRGYWRLLESIFSEKAGLLSRAVAMTATGAKPGKSANQGPSEDDEAQALLEQVPIAVFAKALRAVDRREIESYRALYGLLHDYVRMPSAPRPLSVAVFGPPGAGKSFGVKMVAEALGEVTMDRPIEALTFNISQYQKADDLAHAFHLVRDSVLAGNVPLVFFDEFDTSLDGKPLGWLRYFLAPMQDGEFLDRGTPHPIGQAIFVFAGGYLGILCGLRQAVCPAKRERRRQEGATGFPGSQGAGLPFAPSRDSGYSGPRSAEQRRSVRTGRGVPLRAGHSPAAGQHLRLPSEEEGPEPVRLRRSPPNQRVGSARSAPPPQVRARQPLLRGHARHEPLARIKPVHAGASAGSWPYGPPRRPQPSDPVAGH